MGLWEEKLKNVVGRQACHHTVGGESVLQGTDGEGGFNVYCTPTLCWELW